MAVTGLQTDVYGARGSVDVLGVRVHTYSRRQAVEQVLLWVQEKTRRMVLTAGPEFIMMTQVDHELRQIADDADLVTPDGIGVVWAVRRQGQFVPDRVTGVELADALLSTAANRNQRLRVFLLGAHDSALGQALKVLQARYPGVTFAGHNGYFSAESQSDVLQQVAEFAPDLWFVGLGQPRQERFIYQVLKGIPPCVAIGVGGSIDVWGGTVKRAPQWVRRVNLEWLYRLVHQPSRWRRQLALPRFAWKVLRTPGRPR
ncbi:glycosyltransferase [Alicyclobacillaceae bacterium I2511]|nr:glycosyltransferase [Alicyclobacillaceae bacterium I2511]